MEIHIFLMEMEQIRTQSEQLAKTCEITEGDMKETAQAFEIYEEFGMTYDRKQNRFLLQWGRWYGILMIRSGRVPMRFTITRV